MSLLSLPSEAHVVDHLLPCSLCILALEVAKNGGSTGVLEFTVRRFIESRIKNLPTLVLEDLRV